MTDQLSFEQIDANIKSANLAHFQLGGAMHFTSADVAANPGAVLTKICGIYRIIRPILNALANFPLIPAGWKAAIKTFMGLMDSICPQ